MRSTLRRRRSTRPIVKRGCHKYPQISSNHHPAPSAPPSPIHYEVTGLIRLVAYSSGGVTLQSLCTIEELHQLTSSGDPRKQIDAIFGDNANLLRRLDTDPEIGACTGIYAGFEMVFRGICFSPKVGSEAGIPTALY